jgi:hypothetical protein
MLDRGATRPSTAPVPGPRAGRCAAPAPRTANARRDPGPIVGSLRRLGWGGVHDASRPGGSGAGTARRGAPRPAFSGQTLRAYSPGPCLLLKGAGRVQFKSRREVMRSTTAMRPARHPEERRRAEESAGQTVAQPRKGSDGANRTPIGMHPSGLVAEGRVTSVCAGHRAFCGPGRS